MTDPPVGKDAARFFVQDSVYMDRRTGRPTNPLSTFNAQADRLSVMEEALRDEPTEAMIEAGANEWHNARASEPLTVGISRRSAKRIYLAMRKAALAKLEQQEDV